MKLQQALQEQEKQRKEEAGWNNERFALNQVIFCIRSIDLVTSPFGKHGELQYELQVWFVWEKKKQTAKQWFSSNEHDADLEPTYYDKLFRRGIDWPAHNFQLAYNVPGDKTKGYHFVWMERNNADCPCSAFKSVRVTEVAGQLPAGPVNLSHLDATAIESESVLTGEGFEPSPPATEEQKTALLKASTLMMSTFGKRIDPGDLDTITSAQAEQRLIEMRLQWASESATKAKSAL